MLLCVGSATAAAPVQASAQDAPAVLLAEGERLATGLATDRERAVALLTEAIERASAAGDEPVEATARRILGDTLLNLGRDLPVALAHFERAAGLDRGLGRTADAARADTLAGIALRRLGRLDDAEAAHRRALAAYVEIGDRSGQAAVLHNLGALLFGRSRLDEAVSQYEQSIGIRRAIGEVDATASTLNNLATIHGQRGDLDKALDSHREALAIAEASGNEVDRAYSTLGLGSQSFALGELQESIAYLSDAARLFEALGDRSGLGFARQTLGVVYLALGHDADAATILEQTLPLREHDPARQGTTLQSLAGAYRMRGQYDLARTTLERALALKRQASDRFGEAATLRSLAALALEVGQDAAAARHADDARALSEQAQTPDDVALAIALQSRARGSLGDAAAIQLLDREIAAAIDRRRPRTEVVLRAERARVAIHQGDLDAARIQVAEAITRVESMRAAVASLDLRATYLASQADLLDLQVDVLLRSHRAAPAAGYDRAAFEAAERARGRRVLDALGDAALPRPDMNETRARERDLERAVSVAAIRLERSAQARGADALLSQTQLDARLLELRQFRSAARAALPWRREVPPPDLAGLQRALPADSAVVAYWLGTSGSAAWVVTPASVMVVELAPGPEIRQAVTRAYGHVTGEDSGADPLDRLASLLIRPLEQHLTAARLALLIDGPLEYVPFAALRMSSGAALVARHDIVRLPVAVWPARTQTDRAQATHIRPRIAVVADPVFSADDGRVRAGGRRVTTASSEGERTTAGAAAPARLQFSRLEADAIGSLAGNTTLLTDFQASKRQVAALRLDEVDVLHVATHARQHGERPDLSSVVLSLVDDAGSPVDGYLRLHEVVGMSLRGQTVVLSACQTVIGPNLRGDGLQGLARAFIQAGAGAVVASLWDVDDRATMVLMRHFYQALVSERLTPDRALARAQRAMQSDRRWQAPQHWAGFVVLGAGG